MTARLTTVSSCLVLWYCFACLLQTGLCIVDLKPANVVHLMDWYLLDFENVALLRANSELQQIGVPSRVGGRNWRITWVTAAPEYARAVLDDAPIEASAALDVWAWGITLVYIATGRYLFDVTEDTAREELVSLITAPERVTSSLLTVGCLLLGARAGRGGGE